jgi:hypothetical protein
MAMIRGDAARVVHADASTVRSAHCSMLESASLRCADRTTAPTVRTLALDTL